MRNDNRGMLAMPSTVLLVVLVAGVLGAGRGDAQPASVTLRVASVSQGIVHREVGDGPGLAATLDRGVTDGVVFAWTRGRIGRAALVSKPIRVLAGPEAAALGGRGEFALEAVRPPAGASAWTEVVVVPRSRGADDVLVLEIGGEVNTIHQVLAVLLVGGPGGPLRRVPLARRALFSAPGVPILRAPFGRPVDLPSGVGFHEVEGLGALVARSLIEAIPDGDYTPRGPADRAATNVGDWREGDRVLLRASLAALAGGVPAVVLGWKDRTDKPDPEGDVFRPARFDPPR